MPALEIPYPDDDPQLAELRKRQACVHREIQANSEVVVKFKAQRLAAESLIGPQGSRRAPTRADEERAKAASRAVRAARVKLRDLEQPLREARAKAAASIVADVRPHYLKLIGEFALAYLRQRADEIIAIERVFAFRRELAARQVSMAALPLPPFDRSLDHTERRHQRIRDDAKSLIEGGAIKSTDLPKELRKIWGLK